MASWSLVIPRLPGFRRAAAPQPDGAGFAPAGQQPAVGGERHRPDLVRVPGLVKLLLTRGHVPHDEAVVTPRGQGLAVAGEGDRQDVIRVALAGGTLLAPG